MIILKFGLDLEDELKSSLKSKKAKVLVDKHVGGKLLDALRKAFSKMEFVHVGVTEVSDAADDVIVDFAVREGYDIVVTMDYGMARKALLGGLSVILIFEAEQHKSYVITYIARLGEVRFKTESTL